MKEKVIELIKEYTPRFCVINEKNITKKNIINVLDSCIPYDIKNYTSHLMIKHFIENSSPTQLINALDKMLKYEINDTIVSLQIYGIFEYED